MSVIACNPSSPAPSESNTIADEAVVVSYAENFGGLIQILNNNASITGNMENQPFEVMGVELGTITVSYTDASNYDYNATFEAGTHSDESGSVEVVVGNNINIDYSITEGNATFTVETNGGSSLAVNISGSNRISAELPWDISKTADTITVDDKSYSATDEEANAFGTVLVAIMEKYFQLADSPISISGNEGEAIYSFSRTADSSDEEWADAKYEGTYQYGSEEEVAMSFTVTEIDGSWGYKAMEIAGEKVSSQTIDAINSPMILISPNLEGSF